MAEPYRCAAFLIHLLTASGAAFALLALFAAHDRQWSGMFLWLGCALIADAIDGPLARRFKIGELLRFYQEKYHDGSVFHVLKSLSYFDDADEDEDPIMLDPVQWGEIKEHISKSLNAHLKNT